jgi:hypothetical protein
MRLSMAEQIAAGSTEAGGNAEKNLVSIRWFVGDHKVPQNRGMRAE